MSFPTFTRRQAFAAGLAPLAPAAPAPISGGLSLNEDNSHFYFTRAGKRLTAEEVDAWVDQYAGTQVRELMLCPNSQRTSYASQVWNPVWRGYDPKAGEDQPLFASLPPGSRKVPLGWIHTAWQLHQDGIDPYQRWIARARQKQISPWISMRMNDIHNVDDERCYIHSEFWRSNPQFRRVPYRLASWPDRAFDYGHPEVREYHMKLVRELAERYDFDGLELDWMRFGYHFRPGAEREGAEILTRFMAETRALLDRQEQKRGHKIRLGARVASRPQSALNLGMDAATWARRGLLDMLVITPFWATIETDMPVETWKNLLRDTKTILGAGLEVLIRAHPDERPYRINSLETVRGAAASLLDRGADRVYLFNYMDDLRDIDYQALLREVGSLETLRGKPRRHVITYPDTWAPGEPRAIALPAVVKKGQWQAFRVPVGPKPASGRVLLGIEGEASVAVRVNGTTCEALGKVEPDKPRPPQAPVFGFSVPANVLNRGDNVIDLTSDGTVKIVWVEISA